MSNKMLTRLFSQWSTWLFVIILVVGIGLRAYRLEEFPVNHETNDEYAWTFLGASLLETGVPYSWSYFSYPQRQNRTIDGVYFPIVHPALDHPPLFGFIPGVVQFVFGQQWDQPLSLALLRLPMVVIGALNLMLLFWLGKKWLSVEWGLVAMSLYAVSPGIVFGSRMILSENLIITFLLLLLLLIYDTQRQWSQKGIMVISALSVMTKLSGIALGIAATYDLYQKKDKRWKWALAGTLLGLAAVVGYAAWFDGQLFTTILIEHTSSRHSTFANVIISFFLSPKVANRMFLDGFILLGKLALFKMMWDGAKVQWQRSVGIFAIVLLALLGVMTGETIVNPITDWAYGNALYGWYLYPFYPLFILALTQVLSDIWKSSNKVGFAVVSFFLLLQWRFVWLQIADITNGFTGINKTVVVLSYALIGLGFIVPNHVWKKYVVVVMAFFILCSCLGILWLNPVAVENDAHYLNIF
jgi:hypothetical protein